MLQFHNGAFKIMQIADVQELPLVSPDTVKLISLAIEKEKPDLVIFTGDQLYGLIPLFRVGDPTENARSALNAFLTPVEAAGIPFAVTFGNHDDQCGLSAKRQAEIYAEFPHYLPGERRCEEDPGTLLLAINGADGKPAARLLLVDAGRQQRTGAYEAVTPEQLMWIKRQLTGKAQPVFVFQHIPVPEFYGVLERTKRGTPGAAEAFRTHAHEFYRLPDAVTRAGGFMGETPAVPDHNSGEFELLRSLGTVRGIFVGHDHKNSFAAALNGITLAYTQSAGFHAYGPGRARGVRVIELRENDPAAFTTRTVAFHDLTRDPFSEPLLTFALDHLPTKLEQAKRIALAGGAAALCAAGALAWMIKRK